MKPNYAEALEYGFKALDRLDDYANERIAFPEDWGEVRHEALRAMPKAWDHLARSVAFWWDASIVSRVSDAASKLPDEASFSPHDAIVPGGWFWTASGPADAVQWSSCHDEETGREGLLACWYSVRNGAPEINDISFLKTGQPVLGDPKMRWLLAALYFIRQRIVVPRRERPERHARKRLLKLGADMDAEINVVVLRSTEKRDSGEHQAVDWNCRWWVSSHWRNQFYPSTGDRRHVLIQTHMKGPDDKAVKPRAARAFVVAR